MNDTAAETVNGPATAAAAGGAGGDDEDEEEDGKLRRAYFGPTELANAAGKLNELVAEYGEDKMKLNFDPTDAASIPEGYGVLIIPQFQRKSGGKGNELANIGVATIPSIDLVMSTQEGRDFVNKAVFGDFASKFVNAIRNWDGVGELRLPKSMKDFLERKSRAGEDLSAFEAIAKDFVTALKNLGLKRITTKSLRQCLQSKAFAEMEYPKLPQDNWEKLLQAMIAVTQKKGGDASLFKRWLANRNVAQHADDIDTLDLSKLDAALAG